MRRMLPFRTVWELQRERLHRRVLRSLGSTRQDSQDHRRQSLRQQQEVQQVRLRGVAGTRAAGRERMLRLSAVALRLRWATP